MKPYAIYLRKSRMDIEAEAKGEGETLARHEHVLVDFAKRKNLEIGKIYREILSGDTIESRPEMKNLLEDVRNQRWQGVLVMEIERLARGETMDQGIVAKAFKISNTLIITPTKTFDPSNEFDEEYFEFGLFMSRREYKVINRRLQRGKVSSVNEGKYVGSIPPFGYDRKKLKGEKGYTLIRNSEANTVKMIYDLYVHNDLSLLAIARKLNEMGVRPRKNNEWSVSSIKDILSNPVYIGKVKWNARKEVKVYKNNTLIKTRPRSNNYILVEGLHESIIDNKTWELACAKRSINVTPVKHNNVVQNPLSGLVICAKCGKKMKRRAYSKLSNEPTLYCDNPKCDNISTKLSIIESKVIEGLKVWLSGYKIDCDDCLEKMNFSRTESIINTINVLEKEYKKENDKLARVFSFLEEGIYTKEVFKKRSQKIIDNIERIKDNIQECKNEIEKEKKILEQKKTIIPKIENIFQIYDFLDTPEEKNILLKSVLEKVTYLKTEKAIKKNSDPTNFTIVIYPKIEKLEFKLDN